MRNLFDILMSGSIRRPAVWLASVVLLAGFGSSLAHAGDVKLNGHLFKIPDGFTIELIAGPPLVDRPITCDFDDQGRMYVSDSSGSNDKVDKQVVERPHRILRLEDVDGDGRYDRRTVFADKMMFPEGTLWHEGSLYVSAPPSIWKLTDKDGDGVAEDRVEWFQGKTLTGCANDLHGPYAGPDGWIYWCKGAFAEQRYDRPGKPQFVTKASHIFRCRPDGSGLEHVMTGGMDNPVDVVFTPGGERVFTTTFLQNPGGGKRDGLIHAVYGGVYGKVHDVIESHQRTGDILPPLSHLGPAAPCGLTRYESAVFGPEFQDNIFASLFNLHKVTRHVLTPSGATFQSRDEDFVVSTNLDFHPTDVQADADGSLVIVDTGGWYKLCCPTSQLWKPDILGGVYRVRRTGAPKVEDPRGVKLAWDKLMSDELARLLGDDRPAVRRHAARQLAKLGPSAVAPVARLLGAKSERTREEAVWALTRIDAPAARAAVRAATDDTEDTVRQAALHSISLWRDRDAGPQLLKLLASDSAHNVRAAAEGLGRLGDPASVAPLVNRIEQLAARVGVQSASGRSPSIADRFVEHGLMFALIEIADSAATRKALEHPSPWVRRSALIALDQMYGGGLEPQQVAPQLSSTEPIVRDTAAWLVGRHPEWGGALAGYLKDRLAAKQLAEAERGELQKQLATFAKHAAIQELLANVAGDSGAPATGRAIALQAMRDAGLKEAPAAWWTAIGAAVSAGEQEVVAQAVATARGLPAPKQPPGELLGALLSLGQDSGRSSQVRLDALAAIPGGVPQVSDATWTFLVGQLGSDVAVPLRMTSADVLSRARLATSQLLSLTDVVRAVGPLEADRLLGAFERSTDEAVGLALIDALMKSSALSSLRVDAVKQRLAKYPPTVQAQAAALYSKMNVDEAKQKAKLEQLLGNLAGGDVRRGQQVFHSTKAACASCHAMGYLGGKVGPDLTRIGGIRTERDLLEAVVFPSVSFVRSYEPVAVLTTAGKSYNGILKKDASDEIILTINATDEVRIPRDEIDELRPSIVSVMPAGLDTQLTPQELADLIAFLKNAK